MTLDALIVLIGTLVFLIGFPWFVYKSTGKPWAGLLMLLGCTAILVGALI